MSQLQSAAGSSDEAHHAKPTHRPPTEWQRAHDELLRLARSRAGLDFEEGRWLVRARQSGVHARLGYGSFSEYVGRLFGYGARLVQEKLRVAEALERLPEFAQALKQGHVCWSALRELTRVATAETETAWLTAGAGRTVRELEKLVSELAPGSRPGDPGAPKDVRHVLRFEVTGEVLACVREALTKIRRDAGETLDEGRRFRVDTGGAGGGRDGRLRCAAPRSVGSSGRARPRGREKSAYGRVGAPAVADAGAKAFLALRGLGFRESEVRWALGQMTHASGAESVETQVRACLLLLTNRLARAS